jgi:thiosulfate dehydrogenase
MAKGFVFGLLTALILLAIGGYYFVSAGALPAGQDVTPSFLETWAAHTSLRAAVTREARALSSPLQPNDENLTAGIALYRANCQVCHGGPDATSSTIAKGLSPPVPQLAKDGVEDDPEGVTYWKIVHGIRFTGMPAFGKSLDQRDLWKVALFLKRMNALPPVPRQAWLGANSEVNPR